jgi:hypothetical protein
MEQDGEQDANKGPYRHKRRELDVGFRRRLRRQRPESPRRAHGWGFLPPFLIENDHTNRQGRKTNEPNSVFETSGREGEGKHNLQHRLTE